MLLLQVGTYIQFWVSFTSKRNKTVVELHQVYVAMPVIYKLPFTHIMFSRMMPTWMRIGHYIEAIMAGFGKIDEVEEALGKIDQLNRGVCPSDIMNFKKALQVIEDAATELIRRAARSGQEGDIVRLMTGKGPYPIRYAGMTDHSGRSIG